MIRKLLTSLLILPWITLSAQWQPLNAPGLRGFEDIIESNGQLFAANYNSPVYRSVSNGLVWQPTTPVPFPNAQTISLAGENGLLVVLVTDNSNAFKVFQSTDDALSWQALPDLPGQTYFSDQIFVSNGTVYCNQGAVNALLRLDNTVWTTVISLTGFQQTFTFRGNDIWVGTNNSLQYSADQGDSWQNITTTPDFSFVSSIAVDNNTLVVASDVGVFYSTNNGTDWLPATLPGNSGLRILADDGAFYAIVGDQLYRSTDGFLTYSLMLSGQGIIQGIAAINTFLVVSAKALFQSPENNPSWQVITTGLTTGYGRIQTAGGALFYQDNIAAVSTDEGDTWQITSPVQTYSDIIHYNGTWHALKHYTGLHWTSTDLVNWTQLSTPLPAGQDSATRVWGYLGATIVYVGYSTTTVYTSNDGGLSWQNNGNLPSNTQEAFIFNNRLYAYQYNSNQLFQSLDFGTSWQEVGTNVFGPEPYVYDFQTVPGKIYVRGEQNLLTSTDGGLTWNVRSLQPLVPTGSGLYIAQSIAFNGGLMVKLTNGILYVTTDDGDSWIASMAGLTAVPQQLAASGNTVYVVDNNGDLWGRNNLGVNVTEYSGLVYRDLNNNGVSDNGEPPLPNVIFQLGPTNQYTISSPTGTYRFFTETPNDVLTPHFAAQYCSFNPASYTVSTTNTQLDFGLNCPAGITDLALTMATSTVFRPGFDTDLYLTARHLGNDAATGTVTLTLDPTLQFVSATPAAFPVNNVLTWSFSGFQLADQASFVVRVNTPATTVLGTTLCLPAQVSHLATDQNPLNNMVTLCSQVVGSYDPNDKQVSPALLSPADLSAGKPLVYTVRFQNTGNYPATFIVIKDTLSPNLDPATLQVLSASHPMTWSLRGNGIIEFRFDGINLPDMNTDEPGSHGFVAFSVAPKGNLPLGEMTQNTAYIYFDYNSPIITNTVTSTVVSAHEPANMVGLVVQPNPSAGPCSVWFDRPLGGAGRISLSDAHGRDVGTWSVPSGATSHSLDLEALPAGLYWVKLTQNGQATAVGKVIRL